VNSQVSIEIRISDGHIIVFHIVSLPPREVPFLSIELETSSFGGLFNFSFKQFLNTTKIDFLKQYISSIKHRLIFSQVKVKSVGSIHRV